MLHPDRYETYVLVEPHTGASLSGHARMQVSTNRKILFDNSFNLPRFINESFIFQ